MLSAANNRMNKNPISPAKNSVIVELIGMCAIEAARASAIIISPVDEDFPDYWLRKDLLAVSP